MGAYETGQRWTYYTRGQDAGSTLIVGQVDGDDVKPAVIHIRVEGIASPHSDTPIEIGHMPFTLEAMDASVVDLVAADVTLPAEFAEGIATWKNQQGGVFSVAVAEAIDGVLSAMPAPFDDPFDDIVTEMREKRTDAMIDELYRHLFALDQWYFLCEPDDPRAPVQWEFPEGANPTPALLAFTSQQRAGVAAIELGLYPAGSSVSIMPATVKEAVDWISSQDCANEWLCFNLTQQNFPLYCDDAVAIFNASE